MSLSRNYIILVNMAVGLYLYVCLLCGGVGGNLVAVQASRLSTALHRSSTPGILPESAVHGCPSPFSTFFSKST